MKIIGRLKDVIVPESGHNVAPAPIEDRLQRAAPSIENAVVLGHGRPFLTALVTGKISSDQLDSVIAQVNQELPHYQRDAQSAADHRSVYPPGQRHADGRTKSCAAKPSKSSRYRDHFSSRRCTGRTSFQRSGDVYELALDAAPCNEIGLSMLGALERFVDEVASSDAKAVIVHSLRPLGFSAGADLRDLFARMRGAGLGFSAMRSSISSGFTQSSRASMRCRKQRSLRCTGWYLAAASSWRWCATC